MLNRRNGIGALAMGMAAMTLSPVSMAQLEEIVVTAQKREDSLQDTPIAITAFSENSIEQNRIEDFSDVAMRTPGLIFAATDGQTTIALRGVGLDISGLGGEPAVAAYQDGVYMGPSFTLSMPSFDMERIEVLRGPQGTLYGRNATGGAINLITRRPQFEPAANAAISYANYDHLKVEAGATGGLTDNIAVRGSVVYSDRRRDYRDNLIAGGKTHGEDLKSGNFSMLITPTDDLEIILRGSFLNQETGYGANELLQLAPPAGTFTSPANVGGFFTFPNPALGGASLADIYGLNFPVATVGATPRSPKDLKVANDPPLKQEYEMSGGSATVDWDLGGMALKSITAYREVEWRRKVDVDGTDLELFYYDGLQTGRTWSQEFNLSGTSFDDRLEWLAGAYYYHEDSSFELNVDFVDTQLFYESLIGVFGTGAPLPPGSLAVLSANNPLGQGIGRRQGQILATPFMDMLMTQQSRSNAAFGEGKYHVTDDFALTVGARWTEDKKHATRSSTSNFVSLLAPQSLCIEQHDSPSWREVTGNVIAEYNLSADSMVFGKVSRGYKAGGLNSSDCGSSFDPEKILAYEVGLKSRFFDHQVQTNSAVFYYDYKDVQTLRFLGNVSAIENAAKGKIFGVETEVAFAPNAVPGFQLSGSLGYLDAEYDDATFSDPVNGGDPIDVSGNSMMRAPEWKASLAAQYEFQTDIGQILLMADANYTDSFYFDVFEAKLPNQSEMKQPSYTVANVRASWTPNQGDYEVMLFVENVTNEIYADARMALPSPGGVYGQFSRPRVYGIRLGAKW